MGARWNRRQRLTAVSALSLLLALGALLLPLPLANPTPAARTVEVEAHNFGFTPARIRVNRGDTVTLVLRSADVTHGLYVDGYGVNMSAVPGLSEQATFTADRTGSYRFRCSVSCGTLHPFMIGQLEVAPNSRYLRSLSLAAVVAVGALLFLWAWEPGAGKVAA